MPSATPVLLNATGLHKSKRGVRGKRRSWLRGKGKHEKQIQAESGAITQPMKGGGGERGDDTKSLHWGAHSRKEQKGTGKESRL